MSYKAGWKPGRWSAICDVCGFKYHSDRLTKRWDGLMVCHKDNETRHPADLLRVTPDNPNPPWTRPETPDTFVSYCSIESVSAYADLGTADCMQADNHQFTYAFLIGLNDGQ